MGLELRRGAEGQASKLGVVVGNYPFLSNGPLVAEHQVARPRLAHGRSPVCFHRDESHDCENCRYLSPAKQHVVVAATTGMSTGRGCSSHRASITAATSARHIQTSRERKHSRLLCCGVVSACDNTSALQAHAMVHLHLRRLQVVCNHPLGSDLSCPIINLTHLSQVDRHHAVTDDNLSRFCRFSLPLDCVSTA